VIFVGFLLIKRTVQILQGRIQSNEDQLKRIGVMVHEQVHTSRPFTEPPGRDNSPQRTLGKQEREADQSQSQSQSQSQGLKVTRFMAVLEG